MKENNNLGYPILIMNTDRTEKKVCIGGVF